MKELFEIYLAAAMLLVSPSVYENVKVVTSDDPYYYSTMERLNRRPSKDSLGEALCGKGSKGRFCLVVINSCLLEGKTNLHKRLLERTIFHEFAHAEDYILSGKSHGHKKEWRNIMKGWDVKPVKRENKLPKTCK